MNVDHWGSELHDAVDSVLTWVSVFTDFPNQSNRVGAVVPGQHLNQGSQRPSVVV